MIELLTVVALVGGYLLRTKAASYIALLLMHHGAQRMLACKLKSGARLLGAGVALLKWARKENEKFLF